MSDRLPICSAVCTQDPYVCPLSRVVAGTCVRIKQLAAPPDIVDRLRELGFCEERQIKLISRHSNLICLVCNARLGISAQLADTIWVEPLPGSAPSRRGGTELQRST